jgi:hypothetical protein
MDLPHSEDYEIEVKERIFHSQDPPALLAKLPLRSNLSMRSNQMSDNRP